MLQEIWKSHEKVRIWQIWHEIKHTNLKKIKIIFIDSKILRYIISENRFESGREIEFYEEKCLESF